ncbi:CCCH zinc finger and RRM domain protein [Aspergillus undulatus]|uniref:CCCH zinc finger and RRM domain protein n=1 Tax=Aspergillus undulatus TaxID=1810928 RepID=UPI003CCD1DE3
MQLTEDQAEEVKNWVVKKLEDISDADSDVLADYVLALIRSDAPDEEIRKASVENLEDFLREHTAEFVEELFATFAPKQPPSAPAQLQAPQGPGFAQPSAQSIPPTGPVNGPYGTQTHVDTSNISRKRTYDDGFSEEHGHEGVPHHRQFKNPRRGRGGRGDWMGRGGHAGSGPGQFPNPSAAGFPVMPPGFPGFDQNDPMAAMMAMQSMGFPQMPGMPPMPMPPAGGQQPDQMGPKSSEKCPFYETQGICYLGAACPYQHDTVPGASKDDEYDPKSSNIVADFRRRPDGPMRGSDRGRGRGRGSDRGGFNNRGRRSEFSSAGPNDDPSVKTIVVEQIPDDKLDEFTVRDFFSQYGEITDISLQPYKKLALITYVDHATAKAAWSSPKVIFDNRFVKVYWYKSKGDRGHDQRNGSREESQPFDPEEFQRQQEEAQKTYEEKLKQRQETEKAKQDLEKQREELLKKQEEEKQRLLQKIGGAASSGSATPDGGAAKSPSDENASEQTKQLRAQLAALEAEAKSLGLDPNNTGSPPFRGRGRGFGGRGGYAPRGRGYDPSYRGSYRGRGGFAARGRGGVLRLDNRPKRVAVSGIKPNSEQDEAFRQFLIGIGEYESITPNPSEEDSLIVAFKERYLAEKFMFGRRNIPSVGEVQLSWVPNPPISLPTPSSSTGQAPAVTTPGGSGSGSGLDAKDEDMGMSMSMDTDGPADQNGAGAGGFRGKDANAEVDYDVAEVEDSW